MTGLGESIFLEGVEQGIEQGMQQGMQQGIEQGMRQGIEQGVLMVARKMHQKGMPVSEIAEYTGVSVEKIERIINLQIEP